jgi:hypothetical protein
MAPLNILDDLQIAAPCPASWNAMRGDDRVRFCSLWSKNVYNVSGLTAAEAATTLADNGGSACVRLYRRGDGTVLTADCPVGLRRTLWRRLRKLVAAGALAGTALWSAVRLYTVGANRPDPEAECTDLSATLADWNLAIREALGLWSRPRYTMGFISIGPPPTTPTPEVEAPAPEEPATPAGDDTPS